MNSAMVRLLITGGAGFIGANLIDRLTKIGGYEITVVDNEVSGKIRDLDRFKVRVVRGDIRDEALLREILKGQQVVVHLAADTRVMDSISNPAGNFDNNVLGSFRLLETCRALGVSRVIAASTGGAILGEVNPPVHEDMVAQPMSPYGASKLALEGYLSAYTAAFGLKCCALRFSNIYGPGSFHKGSVVAHFFKQLLSGQELIVYGDGSQARDFLYVDDLTEGIQKAIESSAVGVYQLGSGKPTTIRALLDAIGVVTKSDDLPVRYRDFRPGEIRETWCNIARARSAFEFNPKTQLSDGLSQTWSWFKTHYEKSL